jgi:HSP20 family protein
MAQYSLLRPWAAEPWGDFDDLHREIDALFNRFGTIAPGARGGVFPAVNLYESGDAYVLTAELPGVSPQDIDISIEGSTLTLRGEKKIETAKSEDTNAHRLERQSGSFRRAFDLPFRIDADKVEAIHKNGVLMLRLPKTAEARPRQISVQAG